MAGGSVSISIGSYPSTPTLLPYQSAFEAYQALTANDSRSMRTSPRTYAGSEQFPDVSTVMNAQPPATAVLMSSLSMPAPQVTYLNNSAPAPLVSQATATTYPRCQAIEVFSVKAAWEKYFGAFVTKDVNQMLACYDEASHVRSFNNIDSTKTEHIGLERVRTLYEELFQDLTVDLTDFSTFEINVTDIDEDAGQVFMAWRCPSCGILSATSTFIYARNFLIWKQNTVTSKTPRRAGQLLSQSVAALAPSSAPLFGAGPTVLPAPTSYSNVASSATLSPQEAPQGQFVWHEGAALPPIINIPPSVHVTVSEPVPFKSLSGEELEQAMAELRKMQAAH